MRRAEIYTFTATFLIVFAVYFATTAPTIGLVDAGELTTAAYTLSIAHPTGYPLYTNLGHVWLMLSPFSPARGMVVFSVLAAALGTGILAILCAMILESVVWMSPVLRRILAVTLATAMAVSPTVWTSVDFAEVYPLTWMIGAVILLLSYINERKHSDPKPHLPLLICYLWGLGFGNHLTILWFAPLILFVALRYILRSSRRWLSAGYCVALYLLGTSINLYLPIRSARGPLMDWSAPHTLPGLIRHLTGWQYRVWMFEGNWVVFLRKLTAYLSAVPGDIGWALTLLAVIGLIAAVSRKSWLLLCIFSVWLLGNLYNVNYDIPDISTYFLAFYAPLFIVAVFGFLWLLEQMHKAMSNAKARAIVAAALALIVPAASLVASGTSGVQKSNYFAVDLTTEVLRTLSPNALVLQGNWDLESPYIYLHHVEGVRPDVVMLDLNLLQRPWYVRQGQRTHPDVFAGAEKQIDDFCREVAPFEAGKPFEGRRIETAYVAMLDTIISKQARCRPVYIRDTYQVQHGGVAEKMNMIPGGYFMRITDTLTLEPVIDADRITARLVDRDDERVQYLLHAVAASASYQGDHAMKIGDTLKVAQTLDVCRKLGSDVPDVQKFMKTAEQFLSRGHDIP